MTPLRLEAAIRGLDLFLGDNGTSIRGPCAKDLTSPEEDYCSKPQIGEIAVKRVRIDFRNKRVYELR